MIPEDPIRIHEIPKGIQNPEADRDLREREIKKERPAEGPRMRKMTSKRPEEGEARADAQEMPQEPKKQNPEENPGIPGREKGKEIKEILSKETRRLNDGFCLYDACV